MISGSTQYINGVKYTRKFLWELTNHTDPPALQHCLSENGNFLLDSDEPIVFFNVKFRKYEFMTIFDESKRYRKQRHFDQAPYHYPCPSNEEIMCFIGLLIWTSLFPLPNRRSYFMNSEIYQIPHIVNILHAKDLSNY